MGPPCVLVVDDDEDHRFITKAELRRLRTSGAFRTEEASDASEGLRRLDAHVNHDIKRRLSP